MTFPDVKRERLIEVAREALGTPFHHQGRLVGVGIDCVGLLVHVAKTLAIPHHDVEVYSMVAIDDSLHDILARSLTRIEPDQASHGDVLCFWFRRPNLPQHVAFRTPRGMLHTYSDVGQVVEHEFSGNWPRRIASAWRYPGVE